MIDPVAALTAVIPGQNGVPVAKATQIPVRLPIEPATDPTPMRVALIGTAAAITVLLATVFVVRTRRRNLVSGARRSHGD